MRLEIDWPAWLPWNALEQRQLTLVASAADMSSRLPPAELQQRKGDCRC